LAGRVTGGNTAPVLMKPLASLWNHLPLRVKDSLVAKAPARSRGKLSLTHGESEIYGRHAFNALYNLTHVYLLQPWRNAVPVCGEYVAHIVN